MPGTAKKCVYRTTHIHMTLEFGQKFYAFSKYDEISRAVVFTWHCYNDNLSHKNLKNKVKAE